MRGLTGCWTRRFERVPRERIYEITGLQFLPFNTVYQLLALSRSRSPLLEVAETLLMMPDLFGWLLTGCRAGERTNASTTQLLDPRKRGMVRRIVCRDLGLPRAILPELIEPGEVLGLLRRPVADELGLTRPITVIAPATHDTASAVAAVPAASTDVGPTPPDWCYLSSGTWSLLGVEVSHPVINAETMRYNFTNEGGVAGTTRLLKNIMGLWLVQECRRTWARAGRELSYEELTARAQVAPPFAALVDPDDPAFLAPGDMPARLAAFCKRTGQIPPGDEGALVRCCLESLALKYRWAIDRLETILGTTIKTIHVVGGGTKNALLCQFTADACGRPVHAGPVEATAIGNILMQALGSGQLGSICRVTRRRRALIPRNGLRADRNLFLDRCGRPVRCPGAGLLVLGFLFLRDPGDALLAMALLLACVLMAGGLFRIIGSLMYQFPHWGWVFTGGAINLILGIMIWQQWPFSGLWVVGMFVGIDMIFNGWTWVMLSLV